MFYRIAIFCLFIIIYISAQAADIFTVDGIKTSSSGETAAIAKEAAIAKGQQEAFAILVGRITEDAAVPEITNEKLADLVQSIEIEDEKITASYYGATLSISFNQAMVLGILKENNIAFLDKKTPPVVVLPLFIDGENGLVLTPDNPWRNGFVKTSALNPMLTLVIPSNYHGITPESLGDGSFESISPDLKSTLFKVGSDYNARKVILAIAMRDAGNTGALNVMLQDIKNPSAASTLSFQPTDLAANEDIFTYAAKNIAVLLAEEIQNSPGSNGSGKISVTIPYSGIAEWSAIKKKLEGLQLIGRINIKAINVTYAVADIEFQGNDAEFLAQLAENGLDIQNNGDVLVLVSNWAK